MKKTYIFAILFLALMWTSSAKAAGESHPAGSLLLSQGTIYRVSDNGKSLQSFDTEARFLSHRYQFSDVLPMNAYDKELPNTGLVPLGVSYKLVLDQTGTVWEIRDTTKHAITEPGILFSWRRSFSEVVPASAEEMRKPAGDFLKYRTGSLVNENGTVWVVTDSGKKSFPSAECFTNFGFSFGKLIKGSTTNYQSEGTICGPAPASTYAKMTVQTTKGNFSADVMTFNLKEFNVVTATANDTDCTNACPVKSLMSYVTEAGGVAAINGTYFCPTDYTDCAGKTNSFYWKVYNSRLKKMINADNGIKEDVPFIGFNGGVARYFNSYKAFDNSNWDITAGINHEPGLVSSGQVSLNESLIDTKERTVKSNRGSLGIKGDVVYAVIARSATVPDMALIMQSLGVEFAVNLDGGGSSSLVYENSYKVGPGRNLPNAIIFSKK